MDLPHHPINFRQPTVIDLSDFDFGQLELQIHQGIHGPYGWFKYADSQEFLVRVDVQGSTMNSTKHGLKNPPQHLIDWYIQMLNFVQPHVPDHIELYPQYHESINQMNFKHHQLNVVNDSQYAPTKELVFKMDKMWCREISRMAGIVLILQQVVC